MITYYIQLMLMSFSTGSSVLDLNPVFGGFQSTTQTNSFVSAGQPSQPAFGSSIVGSSTSSSSLSQQTFGSMNTPGIGSTASPTFDSTGSAFRVSSPLFGAGGGFGASGIPLFGSSTTLASGTSATPAFGVSTPSFNFGST